MSDSARPTPGELLALLTPEDLPRLADFLAAYRRALELTENAPERAFLERRSPGWA